jgi:D-alanyl-D-alanine dipeptidase
MSTPEGPARASGEPLTRLRRGSHPGPIWIAPAYDDLGLEGALPDVWVRATVAPLLERVASQLDRAGHGLLIWDGWRSVELQRRLYEKYRDRIAARSHLTGRALDELVARFVTDPDRLSAPPAHTTGGAVDVSLCDPQTGVPRDLGGAFDELTARSEPGFYDRVADAQGRCFAQLRADLHEAMVGAGFVRLPTEWWHFEYGTSLWSELCDQPALFGAIGRPS